MRIDTEVDNLYYTTIEGIIADYYDMGYPDTSSLPIEFADNESGQYSLFCTKKHGTFNITTRKLTNGKYSLSVTVKDKVKNNR